MAFEWSEYQRLAEMMATCKGKVMFSINDHPDIRALFCRFQIHDLEIKYSVGNQGQGSPKTSKELVITNWDASLEGGLF